MRTRTVVAVLMMFGGMACASGESGNVESLRSAITDLMITHADAYPEGESFLRRLEALGDEPSAEDLAALRREALLAHPALRGDRILVLERDARARVLPQNWQGNEALRRGKVANRIAVLRDLRGGTRLETVHRPESGRLITDIDLHPDADRLMFSMLGDHF